MNAKEEAWDNYVRQRQYYGERVLNDEDEGLEIATTFEPLDAAVREVAAAAVAEARAPLVEALEEIREVAAKQIKEAGWQNRRWLSDRAAAALAKETP